MSKDQPTQANEHDAPKALRQALTESLSARVVVPPEVDEAILRAARSYLGRPPRQIIPLPVLRWMAAAACFALVAGGVYWWSLPESEPAFAFADVNRDGRVDILDAFHLERQIEAGRPAQSDWDLNGDGVVDERDVAVAAAEAVRLDRGGDS
jgi:hypothetical protein